MALGPGDGLQTWEFKVVRTLVAERRRRQRLSVEQAEDLLQECLLHWIQVRQRLSPQARDAGAKYLHRVIENFLADLTRKDLAAKRGSGIDPLSLDFPVGSMEDSDQEDATTLGQLLAEDGSHAEWNTSQVTDLRMDLQRIVSTLTERQQILCKLLGQEGLTPAEAAQVMGVARSTVYLELTQVRERLRDAGLQSYLRG
jgi:RNA polymerase sigma factor (sigma-70 family)